MFYARSLAITVLIEHIPSFENCCSIISQILLSSMKSPTNILLNVIYEKPHQCSLFNSQCSL